MSKPEAKPTARYREAALRPANELGTVCFRATWTGERPAVEPIRGLIETKDGAAWGEKQNPYTPRIGDDGGLADVCVEIDVPGAPAIDWPHPKFDVVHGERELRIDAADGTSPRAAFVPVGSAVTFRAERTKVQIRGRGSEYFSRNLWTDGATFRREMSHLGRCEITSGTGAPWSVVELIAVDHPYTGTTDERGFATIAGLPPGTYEATATLQSWTIAGRDRDPETGKLMRLAFAAPIVRRAKAIVEAGRTCEMAVAFEAVH